MEKQIKDLLELAKNKPSLINNIRTRLSEIETERNELVECLNFLEGKTDETQTESDIPNITRLHLASNGKKGLKVSKTKRTYNRKAVTKPAASGKRTGLMNIIREAVTNGRKALTASDVVELVSTQLNTKKKDLKKLSSSVSSLLYQMHKKGDLKRIENPEGKLEYTRP